MCRATIVAHSKGSLFASISSGLREQLKAAQQLKAAVFPQLYYFYNTGTSSDTDVFSKS